MVMVGSQTLIGHLAVEQAAPAQYELLHSCMNTSFVCTNPFIFTGSARGGGGEEAAAAEECMPSVTRVSMHSANIFQVEELLREGSSSSSSAPSSAASPKKVQFPYVLQIMTLRLRDGSTSSLTYLAAKPADLPPCVHRATLAQLRLHVHCERPRLLRLPRHSTFLSLIVLSLPASSRKLQQDCWHLIRNVY